MIPPRPLFNIDFLLGCILCALLPIVSVVKLKFNDYDSSQYGFASGWSFFDRNRDVSYHEWEFLKYYLVNNLLWYLIHLIACEICRYVRPNLVPWCHGFVGLGFVLKWLNFSVTAIVLLEMLTFYYLSLFINNVFFIWIFGGFWLFVINIVKHVPHVHGSLTFYSYEEYFSSVMILSWGFLKCISFNISKAQCKKATEREKYDFVTFAGYFFYLPTIMTGPPMIFDRYKHFLIEKVDFSTFKQRSIKLAIDLIKIFMYINLMEITMHFFYVHYLKDNIEIIKNLDSWSFYGFGYLIGQFFYMFYMISYGLAIALAKFDGMNPPGRPRCIARIHLYSDMWKHFDQGLYEFLFKYIYVLLCTKKSPLIQKIFASFVTFGFIYVWHGLYYFIFVWTVLNFICLYIEKTFRYMIETKKFKEIVGGNIGHNNEMRLVGLIGSQIFIPATVANFYFFAGEEVGDHFLKRIYTHNNIICYLVITLFSYSVYQCSESIIRWEKSNKKPEKKLHEPIDVVDLQML